MKDMHEEARKLLYELRGVPDQCSFCGQMCDHSKLEPEECGDWVCHDCLAHWNELDKITS